MMSPLEFVLSLFGICLVAGFFGSLVGLGGGIIVVPAPTLIYGIDIRYAIGASIVSVAILLFSVRVFSLKGTQAAQASCMRSVRASRSLTSSPISAAGTRPAYDSAACRSSTSRKLMKSCLCKPQTPEVEKVTVRRAGGDWSIVRPFGSICPYDAARKHAPVPILLALRTVTGDDDRWLSAMRRAPSVIRTRN